MSSDSAPLSPPPADWFGPDRARCLAVDLGAAVPSLTTSGLLRQAIEGWIRQQLANEAPWGPEERAAFAEPEVERYKSKRSPAKFGHSDASLLLHLSTGEGCRLWARAQWADQLSSLYLQRKSDFDQASCSLLRVSSPDLARELFFRIRSGEASFNALAAQFSEGPERQTAGRLPKQPMARLPHGLPAVLASLKPGELTMPCQLGPHWALVQLHELDAARFDDPAVQDQLLSDQLSSWLSGAVSHAISLLVSGDDVVADTVAHADP